MTAAAYATVQIFIAIKWIYISSKSTPFLWDRKHTLSRLIILLKPVPISFMIRSPIYTRLKNKHRLCVCKCEYKSIFLRRFIWARPKWREKVQRIRNESENTAKICNSCKASLICSVCAFMYLNGSECVFVYVVGWTIKCESHFNSEQS